MICICNANFCPNAKYSGSNAKSVSQTLAPPSPVLKSSSFRRLPFCSHQTTNSPSVMGIIRDDPIDISAFGEASRPPPDPSQPRSRCFCSQVAPQVQKLQRFMLSFRSEMLTELSLLKETSRQPDAVDEGSDASDNPGDLPEQLHPRSSPQLFRPLPSPSSYDLYRNVKVRTLFNDAVGRRNELAAEANRIANISNAAFKQAPVSAHFL